MPVFQQKISKTVQSFEITVYEIDTTQQSEVQKLEGYLIDKVKKIRIFNDIDDVANMLKVPNVTDEFTEKFKNQLKDICNPTKHKIAAFDIRRSYVTEFMSQLLLESNYNCLFYDEADKRLNADAITIAKHSPGIDVIGIQVVPPNIKFVVCEVKASKSKIPCTETGSLLTDIKESLDLKSNRLTKEILNYISHLDTKSDDELMGKIVQFLVDILSKTDDEQYVMSNIIFFPFLLRNNADIIANQDTSDFDLFAQETFSGTAIKGVIWSFNNDIDTFCNKIWEEALTHA